MVRKQKRRDAEIPTASLADIAFLILIFFLATTTIDVDKGLGITLPAKGETKDIKKKNILDLLINQTGEVMLDNEPVEVRAIKQVLQQKLLENDLLIISVKATPETEYRIYVEVMDQIKQSGAKRISIAEPYS